MQFEPSGGSDIRETIEKAKRKATSEMCSFRFNGVVVQVCSDSSSELLYRDWDRAMKGYLGDKAIVGPYPSALLTESELANDARIESGKNAILIAKRNARELEESLCRQKLFYALEAAPQLAVTDAAGWELLKATNSTDEYSECCVRFAEHWGRLMQARIEAGEPLSDIADKCCAIADGPEGITGFMYGSAVAMLARFWSHGEDLRRWHNLKTQISDEGVKANESGGVLNPALLRIG